MSDRIERPNTIPWPPIIYVVAILVALLANAFYPLPWLLSPLAELAFAAGVAVLVGAAAIEIAAVRALRGSNTTVLPTRRSDHLVTSGPFSFSRNPIYLGNTMLVIGAALVFGLLWLLAAAFVAAYATTKLAIEREEHHLEHRFGKAFRDYRKRVRRWI